MRQRFYGKKEGGDGCENDYLYIPSRTGVQVQGKQGKIPKFRVFLIHAPGRKIRVESRKSGPHRPWIPGRSSGFAD
jgi:hypothetical protein